MLLSHSINFLKGIFVLVFQNIFDFLKKKKNTKQRQQLKATIKTGKWKDEFWIRNLYLFDFIFFESSKHFRKCSGKRGSYGQLLILEFTTAVYLSLLPSAHCNQDLWVLVPYILPLGLGCWSQVLDVHRLSYFSWEDLLLASFSAFLPTLSNSLQCSTVWENFFSIFSDFD